jgi:hypothetical protein
MIIRSLLSRLLFERSAQDAAICHESRSLDLAVVLRMYGSAKIHC